MKCLFVSGRLGGVFLLLALLAVPAGNGRAAGANEEIDLVIESRPQGQNFARYQELEGPWSDSQVPPAVSKSSAAGLTPQGKCGVRKVLFFARDEPDKKPTAAAARFTPQVSRPARCHVYVTWPTSANARPVVYTVRHAGGEDRLTLAQEGRVDGGRANANQWISLGAFDFAPGPDHYVELRVGSDVKPGSINYRGQVVADAVRFMSQPLPAGAFQPLEALSSGGGAPTRANPRPSAAEPAPGPVRWKKSLDEALAEASASRKPILLYFCLPGSAVCRQLDDRIFANSEVQRKLAREYVPVQLSMADNSTLAARLGVYRGGTVVVYSSDGSALGMIRDVSAPAEFLTRLADLSARR